MTQGMPLILADYVTGAFTGLVIMVMVGAVISLCLLIAAVLHMTGNYEDRNRFLRVAKLCVLVGIVLVVVEIMYAKFVAYLP